MIITSIIVTVLTVYHLFWVRLQLESRYQTHIYIYINTERERDRERERVSLCLSLFVLCQYQSCLQHPRYQGAKLGRYRGHIDNAQLVAIIDQKSRRLEQSWGPQTEDSGFFLSFHISSVFIPSHDSPMFHGPQWGQKWPMKPYLVMSCSIPIFGAEISMRSQWELLLLRPADVWSVASPYSPWRRLASAGRWIGQW